MRDVIMDKMAPPAFIRRMYWRSYWIPPTDVSDAMVIVWFVCCGNFEKPGECLLSSKIPLGGLCTQTFQVEKIDYSVSHHRNFQKRRRQTADKIIYVTIKWFGFCWVLFICHGDIIYIRRWMNWALQLHVLVNRSSITHRINMFWRPFQLQ